MNIIIIALFFHWVGDFLIQTDEQALNKSNSNKFLLFHCLSYAGVLGIFALLFGFGWSFLMMNFGTHFIIDYISSRINKKLWNNGNRHWFFVSIGFDQCLHLSILILTIFCLK